MLNGVAHFVGGNARGRRIATVIDFRRQVQSLVQRIVMVRQESVMLQHLHVGNARIHKDGLRHISTGKAARNADFLASVKTGLDHPRNATRKGKRHQENHHV